MKICQIAGDMSSDHASDQYPTVPLCDACVQDDAEASGEDSDPAIISTSEYDSSYGDTCEFCGKTVEEEAEEQD